MTFETLKTRWSRFAKSRHGHLMLRGIRALFLVGVIGYLAFELTQIGWREIWKALPTHPLFYVLFLLLYFLLPFFEVFLYRITWTFERRKSLPAFVKKRIYNKEVLQYSGEVYFYAWARKHVGLPDLDILKTIRDQNIVSSVASTMVAVVLVALFLYTGQLNVQALFGAKALSFLVGGGVVILVLAVVGVRLRKYLFSMALRTTLLIFALHCLRLVVGQVLQIGQWAVAMPEVPLRIWFTYAALSIIISRIPIIPNRDLIFLGAGVSLSGLMEISPAGVASMLVAVTVLGKVLNLILFSLLSLTERRAARLHPPGDPADGPPDGPAAVMPAAEGEAVSP